MQTVSAAPVEVEIKGALYAVEPIAPGEFGTSAVRVTKLVNGESYDLIRTSLNVLECSCPDFVVRHDGKGTCCKHLAAMVARGYLPVATPAPAPKPAPAPVTAADLKRAAYFKLNIPKPAPAPVAVVARVETVAPDLSTLTIDVAPPSLPPIVRTTEPRPADRREVISWLGHQEHLRAIEAEAVAEAEPEIPAPKPAESWPAWTDEVRWTITEPDDEPRPTAGPDFEPTPLDAAEWQGMALRLASEPMAELPDDADTSLLLRFAVGQSRGLEARLEEQQEELEYLAWLDALEAERTAAIFAEPGDDWPTEEVIRAVGVVESRLA